ncbi:Myg1 [Sergentomyia squamirostris]
MSGEMKKIGTHDGNFHCDEALACFLLKNHVEEYKDAEIIRTRKDEILDKCDIVVDVGGVFDPAKKRYDHHQKSFQESLSSLRPEFGSKYKIRLSSAGLIYVFYGEEILRDLLKKNGHVLKPDSLKMIYKMVYEKFIEEIDAIDNGWPMFPGESQYTINTHLSSRVGNFNQNWKPKKDENYNSFNSFCKAMELVGAEFTDKVLYYFESWLPARTIVEAALEDRFNVHPSGSIIILGQFCPWKQHLSLLEVEQGIEGSIKFVVSTDKEDDHRCMAVPVNPESFICRKFLHKDWRGIRDSELAGISGIPEAKFVHQTGFIGGAATQEAALQMAIQSLAGEYTD